jgi:hypothetical protein
VVQVIVTDVVAMLPAVTALITGTGSGVEKVKFNDVAGPAEFAEITA